MDLEYGSETGFKIREGKAPGTTASWQVIGSMRHFLERRTRKFVNFFHGTAGWPQELLDGHRER
jgi:hypothetical protein